MKPRNVLVGLGLGEMFVLAVVCHVMTNLTGHNKLHLQTKAKRAHLETGSRESSTPWTKRHRFWLICSVP
jgi:hypothetical protein